MIEYQNIFTQVQVRGPVEMGVDNENNMAAERGGTPWFCLLYTSPSPRDLSTSRMPSSA